MGGWAEDGPWSSLCTYRGDPRDGVGVPTPPVRETYGVGCDVYGTGEGVVVSGTSCYRFGESDPLDEGEVPPGSMGPCLKDYQSRSQIPW